MDRLFIIVANQDHLVIKEMVFMYGINAKKKNWMDQVRLIFWGPAQLTLVKSDELQEKLRDFIAMGGEPWACKRCAEDLGTLDALVNMGVKTEYVGELLTQMLKDRWYQITF